MFLDPAENAKSVGCLFLIGTIFSLIGLPIALAIGTPVVIVFSILSLVLYGTVAVGLFKKKRWAIFALGGLLVIEALSLIYSLVNSEQPDTLSLIIFAILGVLFVWFYSNKNKFG